MPESAPVNLHLGPARSGKAAMMRRRYLDLAAALGPAEVLFLVPTGQRRTATLEALLRDSGRTVLWQPQVWTFPRYAEDLLARLGRPARRISPLQQRAFLEQAVAEAARAKQLHYFTPIVDRPGFIDAVAEFIRTLKNHSVLPEAFARTAERGRPSLKEVAAIYARYQGLLAAADLYDDAGLFWRTKDAMAATSDVVWPREVLVDGFQDFSPPERDILRALGDAGARLTITLPCERSRTEVFAWTLRTLDALKATFGKSLAVHEADDADPGSGNSLAYMERHLFNDAAPGQAPSPQESVVFIEAAGTAREVEALARTVKRLLQADPALRPGDVAVILRSAELYRRLVAEIFPRYGLPLGDAVETPLERTPLPRWLLALLRLPVDNYRYRDLAAVLRSPFFPREAFAATEADLEAADRLLLRLGVFEGAENHLRALRQHAAERSVRAAREGLTEADSGYAEEAAAARRVEALIARVVKRLGQLPSSGKRSRYAELTAAMIDEFELPRRAAGGDDLALAARDLASIESLRDALREIQGLAAWIDDVTLSLSEFVSEFEQVLGQASISSPPPLGRGVRLLDVWSSRALSFPVVVLPGLNDRLWPRPEPRHLLDVPENRAALAAAGVPVSSRDDHLAEERFLFYMALTRASARLIVSRPATDDDGRPQLASAFWNELLRLTSAGGAAPAIEETSARDTDLPADRSGNLEELRRAAFSRLTGGGKDSADLLAALATVDPAVPASLGSVAVAQERESARPFGRFDGVPSSPEIVAELARRFPGEHVFSISRLEDYAQCPFRFFTVTVLGLEARELPEEYFLETQVGDIYHDILRDFYLARRRAGQTRLNQVDADTLRHEMAEAVRKVFAAREASGEGGLPALWKIQQEEISERLMGYLQAEMARSEGSPLTIEPRLFEWAFGSAGHDRDDPASVADPLVITSPHGPVRIRGRVDRVDVLAAGDQAQALAVIDYKSGGKPSGLASSLEAGRMLQLPLYLLALQATVAEQLAAPPAQGIYYYLRDLSAYAALDALGSEKKAAQFTATLEAARQAVVTIIDQVRRGQFAPAPAGQCPWWCEFRGLCRTARWRVERKTAETTEEPGAAD